MTPSNASFQTPRVVYIRQPVPQPVAVSGFTMPALVLGVMIGVAACLIALAVVFGLTSIWSYRPPKHFAAIPPLPKAKT